MRPRRGRGEQRGVVRAVVELHADVLVNIRAVGTVAHGRAVVQNGLHRQQFLAAGNAGRQLREVMHKEVALALCGGSRGEQRFAEAAALQLVQRQGHCHGNVGRFQLSRAETVTSAGNGADARQYEGRALLLFLLVVRKDAGCAEDIHRVIRGKVAALEERLLQRDFAHRCEHEISAVNVHKVPPYIMSVRMMSYLRMVSSSAALRV